MKRSALITRIATVILVLSWSLSASAQTSPGFEANQRLTYSAKYYKYKNMKTIGFVMAVGGGILGIAGISKLMNAPTTTNYQGQVVATGPDAERGAAMFLVAIPLVGAGVPLAIVGTVKTKKYGTLLESSLSGQITPQYSGVTVRVRF